MDWMEFHEHLLSRSMERMAQALVSSGFEGVPTTHNFPPGESGTPLNAGRMSVDLVGLDYYHRSTPSEHAAIMRRTSELVTRSEGRAAPAFGAEVGAGFPPFIAPIDDKDSFYTLVCGLAYGLRGFNLYMAVERDRWIGAPIDPHGVKRPSARAYEALIAALERTQFHTLRRRAPVRLVIPRSLRRLARASHAFGPITPAFFAVIGAGFRESCLEDDFGLGDVPTMAGEAYLRAFERALTARGVPFAYAGGETVDQSTAGAQWIIVATAGGVKREFFTSLRAAASAGARVTIGPGVPERDGNLRRLTVTHDTTGLEIEPLEDVSEADALVARRIEELDLPTFPVDPTGTFVCVHEDDAGEAKVVFLLNPQPHDVVAKVALPGIVGLEDLLEGDRIGKVSGGFEVAIEGRGVRMFAVERG
jgi:beta-galactosidase